MTNGSLAESYLLKATKRLKILPVLLDEEAYSDVVREAQELVELALKGVLRQVGIEPPHWHDVGSILREHRNRLPPDVADDVERLAGISAALRKDRELSFYVWRHRFHSNRALHARARPARTRRRRVGRLSSRQGDRAESVARRLIRYRAVCP